MPISEAMPHFKRLLQEEEDQYNLRHIPLYTLPNTIQDIVKNIGLPATMALVAHFGGLALRIPHGATKAGKAYLKALETIVGQEAAATLSRLYGASQLYIPNCKDALVKARDAQLIKNREKLAKQGMSERDIVAILAMRYKISDRYVWKIFKKPVPQENVSRGQGSLFN